MILLRLSLLWLLSPASNVAAFSLLSPMTATTRPVGTRLYYADDHHDNEDYEKALAHNKKRTDVRNLLTQRALQSFILLLGSCRDPHTVKWMEDTYGFANLENYHGTGALDVDVYDSWDTLLKDMLLRPNDVVVVSAKRRGKGHGGWSPNNPHMEEVSGYLCDYAT